MKTRMNKSPSFVHTYHADVEVERERKRARASTVKPFYSRIKIVAH